MSKRRGRGESSIFQRKSDGRWVGSVSLGYSGTGKRNRKTVYGDTKGEVQGKLDKLRISVRDGSMPTALPTTLAALLARWQSVTDSKLDPLTAEQRDRTIRNHIVKRLGETRIDRITALHVETLYGDLSAAGVGRTTINGTANVLSACFNWAVSTKRLSANPCDQVEKPKLIERMPLFLSDAQIRKILDASKTAAIGCIVTLALASGCRQGEMLALTWADVDFTGCRLTINKSLTRDKNGPRIKTPKTKAGNRVIKLPQFAIDSLRVRRATMSKPGPGAIIFQTRTGKYLEKKNVGRAFKALARRVNRTAEADFAPIPAGIRFHDLRHTHASYLLSKGYSLRAVASRLGHANPAVTLRVYGHVMPGDDDKLAAGLEELGYTLATNEIPKPPTQKTKKARKH